MANLVLGPLQRFADETCATVWVETDAPCEVRILGGSAATFRVHDHHYALVEISGLEPGTTYPYEVALDDRRVWPPAGYDLPDPVIRTRGHDGAQIAFGSCRGAAPLEPPWTLERYEDERGLGPDALTAYANRMIDADEDDWPDLLLLLGDQVYADDASPETRAFIRERRDTAEPPWEEIADFTEYTQLYRESWSAPLVRWLLSTVPVAMIFDDHDIIDDWNISERWLHDIRATRWWHERITGGLVAYWLYQHIGNLSPTALAADELYQQVRHADDAGTLLTRFAEDADADPEAVRWSFERWLGDDHLIVVDSRAARVLTEGDRDMLDEIEWRWLEAEATEPCRHLLLATSLPVLMPRSVHDLERWNQRLVGGAWGRRVARWAEDVRQDYDLEHWSAFPAGFRRMVNLMGNAALRPDGPASVTVLSGDVHHGYISRLDVPDATTPVHQVVASPMRQSVDPLLLRAYRVGVGLPGRLVASALARLAGLGPSPVGWQRISETLFDNHVATVTAATDGLDVRIETAHQTRPTGPAELRPAIARRLA
jgi:phosphodiesterase/alkaline phosphatase D-like protein